MPRLFFFLPAFNTRAVGGSMLRRGSGAITFHSFWHHSRLLLCVAPCDCLFCFFILPCSQGGIFILGVRVATGVHYQHNMVLICLTTAGTTCRITRSPLLFPMFSYLGTTMFGGPCCGMGGRCLALGLSGAVLCVAACDGLFF